MSDQPTDIAELCSRDPMSLTDDDITSIIEHYRADRTKYRKAEAQRKVGARKTVSKRKISNAEVADMKDILGDL